MFVKYFKYECFVVILLYFYLNQCFCISRPLTKKEITDYKEKIVSMFYHSYESYLKFASNYDELQPISCKGTDTWGQFSLSLIDALDTLAVFGNYTEFRRVAQLVIETADFNTNINVSVFETNIRVIGGLLSAHLLSQKAGLDTEPGWPCQGPLLRLAEDAARRLLPAFETQTGMPFGTVNLRYGVPENETPITCTAGVGTFIIEFCTLSRLTGDPIFENKAMKAVTALHNSRSKIGLVGNHINVEDGKWTATESGIGAGVDSYFEYLVKGAVMLQMPQLMDIFYENYEVIKKYIKKEDWYVWVQMSSGTPTMPIFQSLEAFWPGVLTLIGDIDSAKKTLYNYHQIWKQYGFHPEFYDIPTSKLNSKRDGYPLRPEFAESILYLYKATKDPHLLQIGADVIESIESSTRTECGFATVKSVDDHTIEDRMESFFLAETLKYLYLLFDETNFVHNEGSKGQVIDRNGTECVIDSGGYVFNTEAHLIDIAAVYCCSNQKKIESNILSDFRNNLDIFSAMESNPKSMNSMHKIRQKYQKLISSESYVSEIDSNILTEEKQFNETTINSNEKLEPISIKKNDNFKEDFSEFIEEIDSEDYSVDEKNTVISDSFGIKTSSDETIVSNSDTFLPTLESSLSPIIVPNVEKTDSQDFNLKTDSETDSKIQFLTDFSELSSQVSETSELFEFKTTYKSVSEDIQPTHSIVGWHSKSSEEEVLEKISVIKDNSLISDKLSEDILSVSTNDSLNQNDLKNSRNNMTSMTEIFNITKVNYELLLCPSQPFLSRLSNFGQMIIYS